MSNFPAFQCSGEWRGRHWCIVKKSIMRKTLTIFCISMPRASNRKRAGQEKEQNELSAIYPHNQLLPKLCKSFYVNRKCKWNING
jgi:hypothetical protein